MLCSAGLDSAVLLAEEARTAVILPIYVSVGFAWEAAERQALAHLLASPPFVGRVAPAVILTFDMRDLYPAGHWAITGTPPAYDTPDEDVYIVGRNITLLAKAAICCAYQDVARLAIGPLAGNPFPDATADFFAAMSRALSLGLDRPLEIAAPFAALDKSSVIRLGARLGVDFARTLSCMNPQSLRHCGRCSKCRERRDAFAQSGIPDPTQYA